MGQRDAYFGQPEQGKSAHANSADLFAELAWRYPSLGLSLSNTLIYANAEQGLADEPVAKIQAEVCSQRLTHAGYLACKYYNENKKRRSRSGHPGGLGQDLALDDDGRSHPAPV